MAEFHPFFISGSPVSHSDSITSFYFRFSGIAPGFDLFLLFQVLQHCARIQSLPFVSGSPASCPDSIPSFCFGFSGIVLGFDSFFYFGFSGIVLEFDPFCFWFSGIVLGFDPFFLFRVLRHRARIRLLLFSSSCPASCANFIIFFGFVSRSLIFPGIVLEFLLVFQSWQLSSISLRYWVRGKNCWSSGFFTRVHFTLASPALRTHDSLVHLLY